MQKLNLTLSNYPNHLIFQLFMRNNYLQSNYLINPFPIQSYYFTFSFYLIIHLISIYLSIYYYSNLLLILHNIHVILILVILQMNLFPCIYQHIIFSNLIKLSNQLCHYTSNSKLYTLHFSFFKIIFIHQF